MKNLLQNKWMPVGSLLLTVISIALMAWLSSAGYQLHSEAAIFLSIVLVAALIGGVSHGLISSTLVLIYVLYHFSEADHLLRYTQSNLYEVIVLVITVPAVALIAGIFRARAQQNLQESYETEARLLDLIQGLNAVVWEADPFTRRYTFVSRGAETILGYPAQQWLEEIDFWANHLHPEDRDRVVNFRRTAVTEGKEHNYEYRMIAANGRIVWLRDRVQPVLTTAGKIQKTRGIIVDATERKHSEDALRESIRRFRETLENVNLLVVGFNLQGNITLCNEHLLTQTGWLRQEIMGKNWFSIFVPPERQEAMRQMVAESATEGKIHAHFEDEIVTRNGERRSIYWSNGFLRDIHGKIIGVISLGDDITKRKHLQEELRQAQKMEAIGRLTGGVAHDFNNLLTAIIGYSELLLFSLPPNDAHRRNADEILKAADRAAALTNQLLAFSRKQVLAPRVLDMNTVVSNMDKILHRLIGEDILLVTLLSAEMGRIKADPNQIEQVILNLIVNARDAMPDGGEIRIKTSHADLDEMFCQHHLNITPGRYVMLTISDTGSGIDAKIKSHIFEPFFTTKEVGVGTGLGLSTVYGIVQQSGGCIDVISEPGQGAEFKIYFPEVKEPLESQVVKPASLMPRSGSETILLVEDDVRVRKLISEVLDANGYSVLEAGEAQEALQISQKHGGPIHLMVTDVIMPGMNGYDLAAKMAGIRPETKVIYISGYTGTTSTPKVKTAAATHFLQKPFTPACLNRKIREILDPESSSRLPTATQESRLAES